MCCITCFVDCCEMILKSIFSPLTQKDPEKIPSPTLDSFFTTLASLRSNDRVPISAVVIDATPGGLGDRLSKLRYPSLRGTSGVVARELRVPLPQIQLGMSIL